MQAVSRQMMNTLGILEQPVKPQILVKHPVLGVVAAVVL